MSEALRILIVGGYGTFGGRLVELLEGDARLTLLVAGRSLLAARNFCAGRSAAAARIVPTLFDRTGDDAEQLQALGPTIVVDASGPFQAYGDNRYRLIEHCISCGIHYLDLADGSEFVAGVATFDAAAKAAGVYVLSGASSFPVLTAAVVRRLSIGMALVQTIHGGIAPSPYAGVGLNVIRAIASYAGQSTPLKRGGVAASGHPFTEFMRFVIAVPGQVPMQRKRFSLVDVPDLRALVDLWPHATEVWMGAAPVPASLHWALTGCAWLVRLRLVSSLARMARAMHWVTNHVRWGEHRGGMFVQVQGQGLDGHSVVREWHMLAEGDAGPLIPSMAVEAIVTKALAGNAPPVGARSAIHDLDLSDYETLFSRRTIYTGVREQTPGPKLPLYQRVLGQAWEKLAPEIQQLHAVQTSSSFVGQCSVERGRNPIAWFIAAMCGLPKAGADLPITVTLIAQGDGERWVRCIDGQTFSSLQYAGRGNAEWLMRERFGPVFVDMALVVDAMNLRYVVRRWGLFGIALPLWIGPVAAANETVQDGKFCFDVKISHPLTGLIVHYRGVLTKPAT